VLVIALDERDDPVALGVAADDCRDDGEQFSRHRDDTLPVGLGRGDDQQRDDLAVGALILADAEMSEFQQLLDPDAAVPQDLDGSPFPEGEFLGRGDVYVLLAGEVTDPDVGVPAAALAFVVSGTPAAPVGTVFEDEDLPGG
jgi:hypothetical protein